MPDSFRASLRAALGHRATAVAAVLLGVALTAPALTVGPSTDDHIHAVRLGASDEVPGFPAGAADLFVFGSGDPAERQAAMDAGIYSWWTGEGFRIAFWRPVTAATHLLDRALWPGSHALKLAHSLLWLGALLAVVAALYRRLHPAWLAGLALLLYAVDDAHGPSVGWLANRNAVVAATLAFGALLAHDRWRRGGWRPGAWLGPALLALALLAGEAAVAILGYLAAHLAFLDPAPARARLRAALPWLAVTAAWVAAYKLLGYGASGSGVYVDPVGEPARFALAAAERVPVLLLAQVAFPWSDLWPVYPPALARAVLLVAVGTLLAGAWLLAPALRRDPAVRFWALGTLLAALPVASTVPADRLLVLVGVGGMGLVAALLGRPLDPDPPPAGRARRAATALAVGVLAFLHLVLAPALLPVRARSMETVNAGAALIDRAVPDDPGVRGRDVIVVTAPLDGLVAYLPFQRAAERRPSPAHLRLLASSVDAVTVARPDARTLRLRPAGGFLAHEAERMLRAPGEPFRAGDRVRVEGLSVEVLAATPDGRPAEVAFRFDRPLEDPALLWLRWDDRGFAPWTPPAVGEEVTLPAAHLERLLEPPPEAAPAAAP